jgi:multidrug efflux pump subunit AcrA (membrane-fusion protein)
MTTGFTRTIRSLRADGFGWPGAGIAVATCFAAAWAGWCSLAKVTLYEVTESARLEVDGATTPVQWPVAGRVVAAYLTMGTDVKAGDVAGEVRDGTVRVELAVDAQAPSAIPLQHGLPGAVEVEVGRVTPAALILRNAGCMLSTPRAAYEQTAQVR